MSWGVWRMWESAWFQREVWPPFKAKYATDARKVEKAAAGEASTAPKANFALGIWQEMRSHPKPKPTPPPPPPPPPPPTYVKVAPRATNMEGGSNVQFCMYTPDGSLRPGVKDHGGDNFSDESGATYHESKQTSSIRDEGYVVAGLPGSRSMDGRSPCRCLADAGYPGDPLANTGAWHV